MLKQGKRLSVAIGLGAVVLWLIGGRWAVPAIIRQAYAEESLAVFNRLLAGRTIHPVERYLDAWNGLFLDATVGLAVLAAGAYVAIRFAGQRRRLITRAVGGTPSLPPQSLIWYAVVTGALGGTAEVAYLGTRQWVMHQPAGGFPREFFWMAPLSAGLAGLLVGLAMAGLAAAGGARWHVWKATVLLAFAAVYGVMQSPGIVLHPASEVILTLGVAAGLARVASARAGHLTRLLAGARPYAVAAGAVVVGFGWYTLPSRVERRSVDGRPAAEAGSPNVLIVILDTGRAANLSLYGYERETTPRLDAWAASGVVFDRAISTSPWTLPSHATLFTGRHNLDLGTGPNAPLGAGPPTLSEIFTRNGYVTAGFTANHWYTTDWSGLERGFDRWEDYAPTPALFLESSWLSKLLSARIARAAFMEEYPWWKDASLVTDAFLEWVAEPRERPFFAFINFIDAHHPYDTPPGFRGRFGPAPAETWEALWNRWGADPGAAVEHPHTPLWINKYDDALYYIDHHLGLIRDALSALELTDNTIVVVTSDHGEHFGEQQAMGHGLTLYDPVLWIPLVMSFPGEIPAAHRVEAAVSLRDIPSTILDLAGLGEASLPGETLASLWSHAEGGAPRSAVFAEVSHDLGAPAWAPASKGDMRSLFEAGYHYILNGDGEEELYDTSGDPSELRDLAALAELAEVKAQLRVTVDSIVGGHAGAR